MKGGGGATGYPLKQTMTMTSDQRTFTTTTEVVELTNTSLDAPLFDMPPGCKVMDMSAMIGGAPTTHLETAPEPAAAPATAARPHLRHLRRRSLRLKLRAWCASAWSRLRT